MKKDIEVEQVPDKYIDNQELDNTDLDSSELGIIKRTIIDPIIITTFIGKDGLIKKDLLSYRHLNTLAMVGIWK